MHAVPQTHTTQYGVANLGAPSRLPLHDSAIVSTIKPIRYTIRCNYLLCSLRALLVALNDESGTVRALAIGALGRLAGLNPAYVLPALRKHLMQLLSDMDHSPDSRQREGVHSHHLWFRNLV